MPEIEYYYAAHSAFAYIGHRRLMEIADAAGATVVHKPFDLRRAMASVGGATNSMTPARRAYFSRREIERWAAYRDVAIMRGIPAHHGNDIALANAVLIAAAEDGVDMDAFAFAMMQAHWRDDADLADPATLGSIAATVGIQPEPLLARATSPEVEDIYARNTETAISRPMFGSPTYFVDGDMFYGQDRLDLVARALAGPFPDTWPRG